MNKTDFKYVIGWYAGGFSLSILLIAGGFFLDILPVTFAGFLLAVGCFVFIPSILHKRMEKKALALEEEFRIQGFTYQYKFTSNSGIFYIDEGGRLGVVWRNNPTTLQLADLTKMTDVRTNNGQQLNGTSLVSCQFRLDGKKYKIYTLRVSNGQFSMKHPDVIEAIEKADHLCTLLNLAKAARRQTF